MSYRHNFGFDTVVSLTGIELDMFICPELRIVAPYIYRCVYADNLSSMKRLELSFHFVTLHLTGYHVTLSQLSVTLVSNSFANWLEVHPTTCI